MIAPENQPVSTESKPNGCLRVRAGIVLIVLSGVFWFSIFAVPFTSFSTTHKALLAGTLFAAVQMAWWTGAAMVGPAAINSIKTRLSRK